MPFLINFIFIIYSAEYLTLYPFYLLFFDFKYDIIVKEEIYYFLMYFPGDTLNLLLNAIENQL